MDVTPWGTLDWTARERMGLLLTLLRTDLPTKTGGPEMYLLSPLTHGFRVTGTMILPL